MNIQDELKSMLKELIPCINGKWFLSDGGLLGIIRDGDLIEWDTDLDIYIADDAEIDLEKLKSTSLNYTDYYNCGKIYRRTNKKFKANTFCEYINYLRMTSLKGLSIGRDKIFSIASKTYQEKKIPIKFTFPFIDIFKLRKSNDESKYYVDDWDSLFYTKFDLHTLIKDNTLGFPIYIPQNNKRVLKMLYGDNYLVPNKDFQHQ